MILFTNIIYDMRRFVNDRKMIFSNNILTFLKISSIIKTEVSRFPSKGERQYELYTRLDKQIR